MGLLDGIQRRCPRLPTCFDVTRCVWNLRAKCLFPSIFILHMATLKECIAGLIPFGIDGNEEPYLSIMRFFVTHNFPTDAIVWDIVAAIRLTELVDLIPENESLTDAEKSVAIELFKTGKTVMEVFKKLRPYATPKTKTP